MQARHTSSRLGDSPSLGPSGPSPLQQKPPESITGRKYISIQSVNRISILYFIAYYTYELEIIFDQLDILIKKHLRGERILQLPNKSYQVQLHKYTQLKQALCNTQL